MTAPFASGGTYGGGRQKSIWPLILVGFKLDDSQTVREAEMKEVGAFEAKNTLSALLDLVEHGEEVVITRHGRPVARLVPSQSAVNREEARAAMARLRARAKALKLNLTMDEIKAYRDEGKR